MNPATSAQAGVRDIQGDNEVGDLLAALAEVARDAIPGDPDTVRTHRDCDAVFDRALWRQFGDLGWLSLLVPESAGGAGVDERAAVVIARALGTRGRLEPFVACGVIVPVWLAHLDGHQAADLLGPVMAGELIAAPAWQPAAGGPETEPLPVTATLHTGAVVLDGTAHWVPVHRPDTFVVAAQTDTGPALVRVDADTPGLTVAPQHMADGTAWCRLELSSVSLPISTVLAQDDSASAALANGVDTAIVAASAELLGLIEHMMELTVSYLGSRRQFGQPIGAFQALQHKAVDMWVQQRLTDAALTAAMNRRMRASSQDRAAAASSVKARASSAALYVGGQAVQLHGAIGFTDEYELAHLVNRALVLSAWLGNAATHIRRYARLAAGEGA